MYGHLILKVCREISVIVLLIVMVLLKSKLPPSRYANRVARYRNCRALQELCRVPQESCGVRRKRNCKFNKLGAILYSFFSFLLLLLKSEHNLQSTHYVASRFQYFQLFTMQRADFSIFSFCVFRLPSYHALMRQKLGHIHKMFLSRNHVVDLAINCEV